ncbi:MAG TPA: glycerophosphodiester phosphodiesterase [Thermoanaerobaculia bacterium]|nr:glycerophosphodiester phosphodiesterase [Thermoanaerobaculia bacterium]
MAEPFLILGHRGSPKRFPENTIASFDECLRGGADGFETDLRLLFDHTAVLYHDDEFGDEPIESLTFTQCSERGAMVERLADLSRYAGRALMILEVKRARWEDILIDHVSSWGNAVIASFNHKTIAELAKRHVTLPLGLTISGTIVDVAPYAERLGATWVFPNYHYVDEEMVGELHERNIRVVPWTVNRKHEWETMRALGCDGVITDLPVEAVQWRDSSDSPE